MRFLNFFIAFIFITVTTQHAAFSQEDSVVLENIISKSKLLTDQHPIEKVYVHFDKPYYSVADTIWFKTYLTMEQNLPSMLSKIVYLDIMSSKDSLVQTVKLPVVDGVASGNIPLRPGVYQQGNYYIKAYTLWMMNFGEEYFFSKTIPIGEAIEKQLITHFTYKTTATEKSQVIDAIVQFKNKDNVVQANKVVNWTVTSNYDVVSKGKGTTDQNGILKIKIDPKKGDPIVNGELTTDLLIADKEVISSIFKLRPLKSANDLQFFPEGGDLIAGVPTRIGFKAVNSAGLGVDLKGTISDNSGSAAGTIESSHLGMGSIELTADVSKTYKATVTFEDGSTKSYDLPKPVSSGVGLQINNTDPTVVNVKIVANDAAFAAHKDKTFILTGTSSGLIFYAAKTKMNAQLINAKIPKDKFPAGIIQITLFSETGQPVSERLAFNATKSPLDVTMKTDLPTYKPRQKVKLTVNAKNGAIPAEGSFSVSVTNETKVPVNEDNEITIQSALLLTAELKGYVEKPNYYFSKPDNKKLANLDVLMLTQGFRRFNFKDIMADKFPPTAILPEQDMRISGTLRDRTGMPVRKGALRLTVPGTTYASEAVTSPSGVFIFPKLEIPDSSEVVINAKYSANGSSLMIMLDAQTAPPLTKNMNMADEVQNIDSTLSVYLNNSKKQYSYLRQLKEVVIEGAKVKKPSHADYSNLTSLGNINGTVLSGERFTGCNSFVTCLQSMAMGLTFFENNFYVSRDYQQGNKTPVQIFINGTPVDYTSLLSVQTAEVENVEIFTKDELGLVNRLYNTNGALIINTKVTPKGTKISLAEFKKLIPEANLVKFKPKGFAKQREFYTPKYVNAANTYNFNDLRTTIYWNPKIATSATGPLTYEFYNADGTGTYRAVLEGVDKSGNISRSVYRYTVK